MKRCDLCGYPIRKLCAYPSTKWTYTTKRGKSVTKSVHSDCLANHLYSKQETHKRLLALSNKEQPK